MKQVDDGNPISGKFRSGGLAGRQMMKVNGIEFPLRRRRCENVRSNEPAEAQEFGDLL